MPDLSSPVIRQTPFGGMTIKDGPRGQYAGADVAISAPAATPLAPPLDADSATYQIMSPTVAVTVPLPSSVGTPGKRILIRNTTGNGSVITVTEHADDGGAVIQSVGPGEEKVFVSTGTVPNNWVLVQHQPTTANSNTVALGGDVVLGSTEPLQRQYQNLDPGGATRNVDLPLPGGSPGEMFLIRNTGTDWSAGAAADFLQVRRGGGIPANLLLLGPGEEALFVNDIAGGDYIGIQILRNPGTAAPAALAVARVLTVDSAEIQLLQTDGAGDRAVDLPALVASTMLRRFRIVNISTAGSGVVVNNRLLVRNALPAQIVALAPGDQCVVVPDDGFVGDWRVEEIIRSEGSRVALIALGVETLTADAPTYEYLDPNGAAGDVVLPLLSLAAGRRAFFIKNMANAGGVVEILTVRSVAGGGTTFAVLLPGDECWFAMDDSAPGAWRTIGLFELRGFENMGALAVAAVTPTIARCNRATFAGDGLGGDTNITLPAEAAFAGQMLYFDITGSVNAGDDLLLQNSINTITIATVAGAAGPPRVGFVLTSDGVAWQVVQRFNLP